MAPPRQQAALEDEVAASARGVLWAHPSATFLTLALVWTAGWSALIVLSPDRQAGGLQAHVSNFYAAMGGLGPTIVGLFCLLLAEGEAGVQRVIRQVFQAHNPALWLLVPLAAAPALAAWLARVGGVAALAQAAAHWHLLASTTASSRAARAAASRTAARTLSAALGIATGHVVGWQGFLTAHVMRSASPLRAAFILGCLAAVWQLLPSAALHAPRLGGAAVIVAAFDALEFVPGMAVLTALYLGSRGSLLLCGGWHVASAAARIAVVTGAASGDDLVLQAALSLVTANVLAVPAWAWLWRDSVRRDKAAALRRQKQISED